MGVRTVTRAGLPLALAVARMAFRPLDATLNGSTGGMDTTPPRPPAHVRQLDSDDALRKGMVQMLMTLMRMKPEIMRTLNLGTLLLFIERPKREPSPFFWPGLSHSSWLLATS